MGNVSPHDSTARFSLGDRLENAGARTDLQLDVAQEKVREALFGARAEDHQVDRFRLLEPVGWGGMGVVFTAYDPKLDRRVAIKLVRPTAGSDDARLRRRLLAEARAMARVSHPNVVAVFEVGVHAGAAASAVFVAMEFVQGETLRAWIERERPDWRRVVEAYRAAAKGLCALHAAGLVHRDFKPENVMIDAGGRVRVMDLGLAHERGANNASRSSPGDVAERLDALTRTRGLVGTPAYMAPEQLEGGETDHRSDQFSLCVSLYEGLWGRRPWVASGAFATVMKVLEAEQPPAPPSRRGVPVRIERAVLRGLARDPADRWPSIDALNRALDHGSRRTAVRVGAPLAMLTMLAGAAVWTQPASPPCDAAGSDVQTVWNDETRRALTEAMRGTGLAAAQEVETRVLAEAEAYAGALVSAHREVCEATLEPHEGSQRLLDTRMQCLRRRQAALAQQIDVLRSEPAKTIRRATASMSGLPELGACTHGEFDEGPTVPTDAESVAILSAVQRVQALIRAGLYAKAYGAGRPLVARAEASEDPMVSARALLAASSAHSARQESDAARELGDRAYWIAVAAHDDEAAALAAVRLVRMHGVAGADYDAAQSWARHAEALIHRSGGGGRLRTEADSALGTAAIVAGKTQDALTILEQALQRLDADPSSSPRAVAKVLSSLAYVYARVGDLPGAVQLAKRALALAQEADGSTHPTTSARRLRLATIQIERGEFAQAQSLLERAKADLEAWGLEADSNYAHCLEALAGIYEARGDDEAADQAYGAALAILTDAFGTDHPNYARVLDNSVTALARLGRFDEARARKRRALSLLQATAGPDSVEVAIALGGLAKLEQEAQRYDAALEALGRSSAVWAKTGADPASLASNFMLAALIHGDRGDWPAMLAAATQAYDLRQAADVGPLPRAEAELAVGVALYMAGSHDVGLEKAHHALARYRADPSEQAKLREHEAMLAKLGIPLPPGAGDASPEH